MPNYNQLFLVMGVSGCGKSTIGKTLGEALNLPFFDGDDFHPIENINKMKKGEPLNDSDRRPWLESINEFAKEKTKTTSLIVACSALKRTYRTILSQDVKTTFIYLKGSEAVITERLSNREGHFMPPTLLKSQFAALEEPIEAITIQINQSTEEIVKDVLQQIS